MAGELDDMDSQRKVRNLLAQLREGSEYLENQKDDLSEMWGKLRGKVFTFHETEKTKSVKKVDISTFWDYIYKVSPGGSFGPLSVVLSESVFWNHRKGGSSFQWFFRWCLCFTSESH